MTKRKSLDDVTIAEWNESHDRWRKEEEAKKKERLKEMFEATAAAAGPRIFVTGATRSPLNDKLCYAGFMDARVIKRYAEYMHRHREQTDGNLRDPDNWKKGIPIDSYMDSMYRHFMDVWLWHQGYLDEATEEIEEALVALMFNVQGMLFEILKKED